MQGVLGLAAAVGALGLAVREPPPAVVAEDLRLVVCGERGLGDRRPRRVREVLRLRLLGLDLGQQGVQPGVLKRFFAWPAARLRRFRVCARGSDSGGSPVLTRLFGPRGPPPRFRPRREVREFRPRPKGSPEGDNGAYLRSRRQSA